MSLMQTLKDGLSEFVVDLKEAAFPKRSAEQEKLDNMYESGYGARFFDAYEALKKGEALHPDDFRVLQQFELATVPVAGSLRKAA